MNHYIIVKWNSLVSNKAELAGKVGALFGKLTEINGISDVRLMPNIIDRPNRYDLMIVITMTPDALPVYEKSEYHNEWKEKYGRFIESKAIFDSI